MEMTRRSFLVYGLLAAFWALVIFWQIEEHDRVREYAKTGLRNRSKAIANTLGASIRGLQFRGAVFGDRLQPVLNELVNSPTNDLGGSAEVISVALLNAAGDVVASAGRTIDLEPKEFPQENERWGRETMTVVYPIEGVSVEGATNLLGPVLLQGPPRRGPRPEGMGTNNPSRFPGPPPPPPSLGGGGDRPPRDGEPRQSRPFWARRLNEQEYQSLVQTRELHGLALSISTATFEAMARHDLWMRYVIAFFASVSVLGSGLAWRNLAKSSELQIRLVRASELNTHLKEMNLAAAGLAHETRNPLNIIRGLAQMISKQSEAPPEIQRKSREIIDEADKVAAQLNEFINYSRPREVRPTAVALNSVVNEVVRALNYDLEEKEIRLETRGDPLQVLADEQLLRQALFNLLINAVQAVDVRGEIQVITERRGNAEAALEIRDNGPGVPPERRNEIFKPYFTTQKQGTGLGLAVVQQIILAHGWEIVCLPNNPKGAVFKITHLKLGT
jgi:signal transduction histidine kinase